MGDAIATWPNIPIGTADTTSSYILGLADFTIQQNSSKLLLANAFSYWTNQYSQNASANFFDQTLGALNHIQKTAGGSNAHFVVGETGWPGDGGSNYGNATASNPNAQNYVFTTVCPALANGIDVFLFEAFDEPQKQDAVTTLNGASVTLNENFWGVMDANRKSKISLNCPK